MLYPRQESLVKKIVDDIHDFRLYEAPTGFGKTFVLLSAAVRLMQKTGKKVIISTANNKLARDFIHTAKSNDFGLNAGGFGLIIGKSNYIDRNKLNRLILEEELFDYITQESFSLWVKKHDDDDSLFFDEFDNAVEYKDLGFRKYLHDSIVCDIRPPDMADFATGLISITNHYYLLYRAVVVKNIELEDYCVLIDEVHEITACAEAVFENSFSPFNLKNISNRLLKAMDDFEPQWKGKKTLMTSLQTTAAKMDGIVSRIVGNTPNAIGEYLIEGKNYNSCLDEIANYQKSTYCATTSALLSKAIIVLSKYSSKQPEALGLMLAAKKEFNELSSVVNSTGKNVKVGIYLSPSKGYPTYKAQKDDPMKILHFQFWEKMVNFAGLSATLLVDMKTNNKSHMYAYLRVGISSAKAKPILQIDRVFPKENIKIFMPKKEFVNPVSIEAEEPGDLKEWTTFVSNYIKDHFDRKNTLVIAGGYKEAEYIAKAIETLLPDTPISHAVPNVQAAITIREFEKTGGILIGTRNYGTGLSLEGEKLERLFVLRLPYQVFTSKKWLDLKKHSMEYYWGKYNNEMLISLRQTLGRLQRTAQDVGEIHLMDSRIFSKKEGSLYSNPELKRRIWHFSGLYGMIDSNTSLTRHTGISEKATLILPSKERNLDWLR